MYNRLHNATNPNQGPEEKVLCLCSAGLLRSPTTAAVMWQKGYNTRAAGVVEDYALIPVDSVLVRWADKIVAMEEWQLEELKNKYPYALDNKPLYNFQVPDMYRRNHPTLVEIIENRVENMEDYRYELLQEESQPQTEEG